MCGAIRIQSQAADAGDAGGGETQHGAKKAQQGQLLQAPLRVPRRYGHSCATSAARAVKTRSMSPAAPIKDHHQQRRGCRVDCRQARSSPFASRTSAVVIKCRPPPPASETPIPIRMKRGREQSGPVPAPAGATSAPPRMPASGRQDQPDGGKEQNQRQHDHAGSLFDANQPRSASPFRVMLCIAAPASSPSIAPHSSAISSPGRRISNRIKRGWSPTFLGQRALAPEYRQAAGSRRASGKACQQQNGDNQHRSDVQRRRGAETMAAPREGPKGTARHVSFKTSPQ